MSELAGRAAHPEVAEYDFVESLAVAEALDISGVDRAAQTEDSSTQHGKLTRGPSQKPPVCFFSLPGSPPKLVDIVGACRVDLKISNLAPLLS